MKQKIQYSCKRKRDFVTSLAIVMFALIIFFEAALIIIVHVYQEFMVTKNKNAKQEKIAATGSKQKLSGKLMEMFNIGYVIVRRRDVDKQRVILHADKLRTETNQAIWLIKNNKGEPELARSALDSLAFYLRENQERLTNAEIYELKSFLEKYQNLLDSWRVGKLMIKEKYINQPELERQVIKKLRGGK